MELAKISRLEYEVKYSSSGKCPHCNEEVSTKESEVLSDSLGDREIAGQLYHNCLLNINSIREAWFEKVKEKIPVISETQCATIVVLEGKCPYCSANIIIRKEMEIMRNSPPAPEPMRYREIHGLEHCPGCNKLIHISGGNFYNEDECPDHTQDQPTKPIEGKRGRPNKTKVFPCPICKGRQKVPESLYGTKDTSDTAETQCKSCHGLGYVEES